MLNKIDTKPVDFPGFALYPKGMKIPEGWVPIAMIDDLDMRAYQEGYIHWGRLISKTFSFLLGVAIFTFAVIGAKHVFFDKPPRPVIIERKVLTTPTPSPTPVKTRENPVIIERKVLTTPNPTPSGLEPSPAKKSWKGKVSHYSRAGCLGCSATLTMSNGEPLDDARATIAFNWLPLNTKVKITNLDNGKFIEAIVTDTGGFNELGRIADLTPAVGNYLGTRTNVSEVLIEEL